MQKELEKVKEHFNDLKKKVKDSEKIIISLKVQSEEEQKIKETLNKEL